MEFIMKKTKQILLSKQKYFFNLIKKHMLIYSFLICLCFLIFSFNYIPNLIKHANPKSTLAFLASFKNVILFKDLSMVVLTILPPLLFLTFLIFIIQIKLKKLNLNTILRLLAFMISLFLGLVIFITLAISFSTKSFALILAIISFTVFFNKTTFSQSFPSYFKIFKKFELN